MHSTQKPQLQGVFLWAQGTDSGFWLASFSVCNKDGSGGGALFLFIRSQGSHISRMQWDRDSLGTFDSRAASIHHRVVTAQEQKPGPFQE